jgi:hypothetical protein
LASNPERPSTTISVPSTPPIFRKMHGVHGPGTEGGLFPQSTTPQPHFKLPPPFPKNVVAAILKYLKNKPKKTRPPFTINHEPNKISKPPGSCQRLLLYQWSQ